MTIVLQAGGGGVERSFPIVWFHNWVNGIGSVNFEPYELRFAEYALNNRRGAMIGRVYLRLGFRGFWWMEGRTGELFVGGSGVRLRWVGSPLVGEDWRKWEGMGCC